MNQPMYELEPNFKCPQCGALFQDEEAIEAHRQQEHIDEAEGAEGRAKERGTESPRPTEPAP